MVDNEVGVGWGVLTDDALTELHELASYWYNHEILRKLNL